MGLEMFDHLLAVVRWSCEASAAEPLASIEAHAGGDVFLNSVLEEICLGGDNSLTSNPSAEYPVLGYKRFCVKTNNTCQSRAIAVQNLVCAGHSGARRSIMTAQLLTSAKVHPVLLGDATDHLDWGHSLGTLYKAGLHLWESNTRHCHQIRRSKHGSVSCKLCLVQLEEIRLVDVCLRVALKVGLKPKLSQGK